MHHYFDKLTATIIDKLPYQGQPQEIAQAIVELSNRYLDKNTDLSQIWFNERLAKAYISYFLPLNILRMKAVLEEAKKINFLNGIQTAIDFGSGPGTFDLTTIELGLAFEKLFFIEKNPEAINWHKILYKKLSTEESYSPAGERQWIKSHPSEILEKSSCLAVFSYSLNEVAELPSWAKQAEALLILEPSIQNAGRNLQSLREKLIENGFYIWAPCTHQQNCPLQHHSKTDWCHTRIHVELSKSLLEIERYLPIKNQSLTYSYLLARKMPAQKTSQARLIGDTLYERGKVKQAVCRGANREFLTWLTRYGEPKPLPRGSTIQLPENIDLRGNEIRMPKD